jgi:hypothetical protein
MSDDEAHLAALLAVLALTRGDGPSPGTPLQQWRARRLAALASSTPAPERPSPHR